MNADYLSSPFLISAKPLSKEYKVFDQSKQLTSAHLYWNAKTSIYIYTEDYVSVYVIGYILDINNGDMNTYDIQKKLIENRKKDVNHFWDYLDELNGRYIIVLDDGNDTEIYTDATSLRPIYYWRNIFFSSHEIILREIIPSETKIPVKKIGFNNGYLDYTSTQEVYSFNPNLYFSFKNNVFYRFFPRRKYNEIELDQVIKLTNKYYKEQTKWLGKNYQNIYLSLTGGMDSKFSLAITKSLKEKIFYFTYMIDLESAKEGERKRIYSKDNEIVKELANNLDLNHKTYFLKDYLPSDEYRKNIKGHISSKHSLPVSYLFYKEFDKGAIHLKSTINEIAKMPFSPNLDNTDNFNSLYNYSKNWQPEYLRSDSVKTKAMFDSYQKRAYFNEQHLYNFNKTILLYWESRMGNWHSNITQETDNTMETFIFVNSRKILNLISYLPKDVRKNKLYLSKTISEFWPILNYFIPNSRMTLGDFDRYESHIYLFEDIVRLKNFHNIDVKNEKGVSIIQPNVVANTKKDPMNFIVENMTQEKVILDIKRRHSYSNKHIFIKLNGKRYSINYFKNGRKISVAPYARLKVEYEYTSKFKGQLWYDAAALNISKSVTNL